MPISAQIPKQYQRSGVWDEPWMQGSNPYAGYNSNVAALLEQIRGQLFGGGGGAGGTTGTTGLFGTHVASPDDPEVQQYMDRLYGEQNRATRDFVNRVGTAGVQRGGMNVAGGPAVGSNAYAGAAGQLAGLGTKNFQQAMDYNKYRQGQLDSQQKFLAQQLSNLLGQQLGGISAGASWDTNQRNQRREDFLADRQSQWDWRNSYGPRQLQERQALDQYQQGRSAYEGGQWDNELLKRVQYGDMSNRWLTPSATGGTTGPFEYWKAKNRLGGYRGGGR